jgi:membrane protein DedA with SNARE-associated domain
MRFIDMKYFERGRRWMQKWGQWVIVANRFLAGTRSVIAITAGIYRTKINYTF